MQEASPNPIDNAAPLQEETVSRQNVVPTGHIDEAGYSEGLPSTVSQVDDNTKSEASGAAQSGEAANETVHTASVRELFGEERLHRNPEARQENFRPTFRSRVMKTVKPAVQYDKFGNRLYTSQDKAYLDRQKTEVKAGLLVSQQGQEWLRQNPGILRDINQGLVVLNHDAASDSVPLAGVNLSHDRSLTRMTHQENNHPAQSTVYLLSVPPAKYVIKHAQPDSAQTQPYINEMLQTQQLAYDMRGEFEAAGVELASFLFATSELSCTEFVEGDRPDLDLLDTTQGLRSQVIEYVIGQRRKKSPLWERVSPDMRNRNNFIVRPDGKIVCIDPFNFPI